MTRALLVIDVQNEYFSGKLPVSYPAGSLDNILRAMDIATVSHIPIVVIQHTARSATSPVFRKGSREWELHPEVAKRQCNVLIEKAWPDSFTETTLHEWLKNQDIAMLTVCGYMTQMCCDTTARRAFHLGYAVEFLSDATGTLSFTRETGTVTAEELHRAILVTLDRFSRVMNVEAWMDRILEK